MVKQKEIIEEKPPPKKKKYKGFWGTKCEKKKKSNVKDFKGNKAHLDMNRIRIKGKKYEKTNGTKRVNFYLVIVLSMTYKADALRIGAILEKIFRSDSTTIAKSTQMTRLRMTVHRFLNVFKKQKENCKITT